MRSYALLSLCALAPLAHAATIDVDVGEDGLTYDPDTVKAAVGDTVNFHFYPGGHSVAQSSFDAPCQPVSGNAIWSGFVNSNSGEAKTMFSMTVNSTDPIWIYCAAPGHCGAGMSMVINPPASGNTLKAYQSASSGKGGQAPNAVFGGVLVANVDNDDNTSSSASGSSTASASGSATATAATTTSAAGSSTTSSAAATSNSAYTGSAASNFGLMPLMLLAPAVAYAFS